MTNLVPISRALISVSDKTGLLDLARALAAMGTELISTGGTSTMLRAAGLKVRDVADVTGFPEMMDGRVKTLHPNVHGALLALRDDDEHLLAMAAHGIEPIDLLIVNLYPFEETVARGADPATCIENIDIGGPAMIRAASKNHRFVTVVTDPADYAGLTDQLRANDGATTLAFRQKLALAAYSKTAAYDTAVATWLAAQIGETTPRHRSFAGKLAQPLRYGENPHQRAAFYTDGSRRAGVATARQWQGKELSYNNINDTDAAFELVAEFGGDAPACAIIKHANPCGVARAGTMVEAYLQAYNCDQTSAFGGIVALNRTLDTATAEEIDKATRYGMGLRFAAIGVVEFIDFGGCDILHHASREMSASISPQRYTAPAIVDRMVEEGRLGLKSGGGFYDYEGRDVGAYRRDVLSRTLGMLRHAGLWQAPASETRE